MVETVNDNYSAFQEWTTEALANAPAKPAAFCFNLYEHDNEYALQVVATSRFVCFDPDWAVDPIFFTDEDYLFPLPKGPTEDDWQFALSAAIELVKRYLDEGKHASVLRASRAVACGFVDGDLHILWPVT